ITVSYKVYTRVQILNYNIIKAPAAAGFWNEDLEVPKEVHMTTEMINGKEYGGGLLHKIALFSQRSGTLELDPMQIEIEVPIRRPSGDMFDQFFNQQQPVNFRIASDPIQITVLPLPSGKAPAGFSGAVGKFQMEAVLDKDEVKTNDAVTLK